MELKVFLYHYNKLLSTKTYEIKSENDFMINYLKTKVRGGYLPDTYNSFDYNTGTYTLVKCITFIKMNYVFNKRDVEITYGYQKKDKKIFVDEKKVKKQTIDSIINEFKLLDQKNVQKNVPDPSLIEDTEKANEARTIFWRIMKTRVLKHDKIVYSKINTLKCNHVMCYCYKKDSKDSKTFYQINCDKSSEDRCVYKYCARGNSMCNNHLIKFYNSYTKNRTILGKLCLHCVLVICESDLSKYLECCDLEKIIPAVKRTLNVEIAGKGGKYLFNLRDKLYSDELIYPLYEVET